MPNEPHDSSGAGYVPERLITRRLPASGVRCGRSSRSRAAAASSCCHCCCSASTVAAPDFDRGGVDARTLVRAQAARVGGDERATSLALSPSRIPRGIRPRDPAAGPRSGPGCSRRPGVLAAGRADCGRSARRGSGRRRRRCPAAASVWQVPQLVANSALPSLSWEATSIPFEPSSPFLRRASSGIAIAQISERGCRSRMEGALVHLGRMWRPGRLAPGRRANTSHQTWRGAGGRPMPPTRPLPSRVPLLAAPRGA